MGCFLACFKGSKDRRRRRSKKKSIPLDRRVSENHKLLQPSPWQLAPEPCATHVAPAAGVDSYKPLLPSSSPEQAPPQSGTLQLSPAAEVSAVALPELKYPRSCSTSHHRGLLQVINLGSFDPTFCREIVGQDSHRATRKKVTFDLNVKTYEPVRVSEDSNCSSEEDEQEDEEIDEERNRKEHESSPKSGAFPLNHRYLNCESSDEDGGSEFGEDDDDECDSDFDEDDEDETGIEGNEDESYDSFFSLPIDEEPKGLQEVASSKPKSASSNAVERHPITVIGGSTRDRSQFVHPVLNPVENLSQWKEVKVRAAPAKNPKKENLNLCTDQENQMGFVPDEPAIMVKKTPQRPICTTKQEVSVDASLSNWLAPSSDNSTVDGPQTSNSHRSNSPFSREERPILGALTIEDIKQSSVTSSPRRSPSKSPPADEIPILGTVARYWNSRTLEDDDSASSRRSPSDDVKGIPNTTSKYREDKTVNWHSTPFEVRLEEALRHGVA